MRRIRENGSCVFQNIFCRLRHILGSNFEFISAGCKGNVISVSPAGILWLISDSLASLPFCSLLLGGIILSGLFLRILFQGIVLSVLFKFPEIFLQFLVESLVLKDVGDTGCHCSCHCGKCHKFAKPFFSHT